MPTKAVDFDTKTQLVDALLACPAIQDRQTRDSIVSELTNVKGIPRSDIDRTDVANIVKRALDFEGGLSELRDVLHFYEGDSIPMREVDALCGKPNTLIGAFVTPNEPKANSFSPQIIWTIAGLTLIIILASSFLYQPIIRLFTEAATFTPQPIPPTSTPITSALSHTQSPSPTSTDTSSLKLMYTTDTITPTITLLPTTTPTSIPPTPTPGLGSIYTNPVDGAIVTVHLPPLI